MDSSTDKSDSHLLMRWWGPDALAVVRPTGVYLLDFLLLCGYILTFPQELQLGTDERFCLTLFNVSQDVALNLNISCYGKHHSFTPHLLNVNDDCFLWHIPDNVPPGTCDLSVDGSTGDGSYTFDESREITVVDNHQITFIQTDRPLYKPGQLVQVRLLTITQDLKPLDINIESILIKDPHEFQMKKWLKPVVKNGIASVEYQLYDEPLLGDWTIVTVINGRTTSQTFTVKQYVLPKFQVNLRLPTVLTVDTKSLDFDVCARYTYGKPVVGRLNATVCLNNRLQSWFCQQNIRPCFTVNTQVSGCQSFTVKTASLNVTSRTYSLLCKPRLLLAVNVTEKNTGIVVYQEQEGTKIWEERVKLEFLSENYFKPNSPYFGKIRVTTPDGIPVHGETIILQIDKLSIDDILISDQYGFANFTLVNITQNTHFFFVVAKTTDEWKNDRKHYTIYPAKLKKQVKQWYSPSRSYITINSELHRSLKCEESVSLNVIYSLFSETEVEKSYYQVISKGNILFTTDISAKLKTNTEYTPSIKGQLLTPSASISSTDEETEDHTELFDLYSPQGPPGWSSDGSPGAPGARGPPAAKKKDNGPRGPMFNNGQNEGMGDDFDFVEEEQPELWHFPLKLHVTEDMFPKVRVLVYFVTSLGEMVADTINFDVDPCIRNEVALNFREKSARPGDNITLSVSGSPGSLCSISMVDKSVYLHGGSNILQTTSLMKKLESYDLSSDFITDWQYCSATSDLPPVLTPVGPPLAPGTNTESLDDWYYTPGHFRKKRSIMQFYSNMYDSLLAFKVAGLMAMTDLDLETRPCLHDGEFLGPPVLPGDPRGPVWGPGNNNPELEPTDDPEDDDDPISSTRDYFPETWLWELVEITSDGSFSVVETVPDTVTQWMGNAFCASTTDGIGISNITLLTSFQPFFLSMSLPYSVIRGEVVSLIVTVFNYLHHCTALQVTLLETEDFEILSEGEEREPSFCICSEQSKSVSIKIKPRVLGVINITVSAFLREHRAICRSTVPPRGYRNKQSRDTVVRQLLVQAEGFEQEMTQSYYICPHDVGNKYTKTIVPDLSTEIMVSDSLRGWVNVIGDIMGPSLSGLENIVELPTGCGEQNMVRLAPNIAVLQYLTVTKQLNQDLEAKLFDHLHKGFQQQMKFMHSDGSYSAFGTADHFGSTWLSAFVFKTFRQALEFIYVDRKQIQTQTWEFLIAKQGEDGCFVEDGKVLGKYMQGGVTSSNEEKARVLTSYVLVAMLESFKMMRERTPPFVALAVRCIEVDNLTDTYTLALTAYAMTLYKPASRFTEDLLLKLMDKAIVTDDMMYWKRDTPAPNSPKRRAPSAEIEITSYALMAILTKDELAPINSVMPIVRWLTHQRNAYGGFTSTQDTVVALQALSMFAERVYGRGLDVALTIMTEASDTKDFNISRDNSLQLQQHVIGYPLSPLVINAKGNGCLMLQTTYRYNTESQIIPETGFYLKVTTPVTKDMLSDNCLSRDLVLCTKYLGSEDSSGMSVIEVRMASGWMPDQASLLQLKTSSKLKLKKYEMDKRNPDIVVFYFDEIPFEELCFSFGVVLETEVINQQPAMAKVFAYYESGLQSTVMYEMSKCSEDTAVEIDFSIDDSDLYIEGSEGEKGEMPLNLDSPKTVPAVSEENLKVEEHSDNVPAPSLIQACPQCVTSGTIGVLHDLCNRQVWTVEFTGNQLVIKVVVTDDISPPIEMPVPLMSEDCSECTALLLNKDEKTLAFLKVSDWSYLGVNIIQPETVILPWSLVLQESVQKALKSCPSY